MKNFHTHKPLSSVRVETLSRVPLNVFRFVTAVCLTLTIICGLLAAVTQAQRFNPPTKLSTITVQSIGSSTGVVITSDTQFGKLQTWQDDEGYHVVMPNTVSAESLKVPRGVRLRQIGTSLEVLMQTRSGARVNVQTSDTQVYASIEGKLIARASDSPIRVEATPEERQLFEDIRPVAEPDSSSLKLSSTVDDLASNPNPAPVTAPVTTVASPQPEVASNQVVPQGDGTAPVQPPAEPKVGGEEESFMASVFSGTSVFIVLALGLFGLLVSQKLRSKQKLAAAGTATADDESWDDVQPQEVEAPATSKSLVRASDVARPESQRLPVARVPVAGPTSLYGAYRIDQEVGKLILGQPHRIDVLASRAIDDRRAIEASLIKSVNASEADEAARRRAREALEEYGFVARQCASLLMAPEAFERTSAARALGEIKSATSLPFLLESLYDSDPVVRNQAVTSIGELKLPSAIGALLDIAQKHPDVPSNLLSKALSSCSVEGLDFFDAITPDMSFLEVGEIGVVEEITKLEPAKPVEGLEQESTEAPFLDALVAIESIDADERAAAIKMLVQYRVQKSIEAIAKVARHDSEPSLRSLATTSLGSLNHESVFPTILIGMSDEAREVRAAAARTLNRLSFDRADAVARVVESGDAEMIQSVARAVVNSGMLAQNIDRLANSDHRQAYETFTLISVLAQGNMAEPVVHAITTHSRTDVKLKLVHLLACTGAPEVASQLRQIATTEGINESVKTATLDALFRLEGHSQPTELQPEQSFGDLFDTEVPREYEFETNREAHDQMEPEFVPELEEPLGVDFTPPVSTDTTNDFDFGPTPSTETTKNCDLVPIVTTEANDGFDLVPSGTTERTDENNAAPNLDEFEL